MEQLTLLNYATQLLSERYLWRREVSTRAASELLNVTPNQLNQAKRDGKLPFQVPDEQGTLEASFIRRNRWKVGFKPTFNRSK